MRYGPRGCREHRSLQANAERDEVAIGRGREEMEESERPLPPVCHSRIVGYRCLC
jgi:hypothetical protein